MESLHFFLEMDKIPTVTAQQKGERVLGGKIVHFDKKPVKEAKQLFSELLTPHIPKEPYEKGIPLFLKITFYYPWKGRVKDPSTRFKTTKPDVDNSAKILIDCMTKLNFWWDDCQISSYRIDKIEVNKNYRGEDTTDTGIYIDIQPIKED